MYIAEQTSTRLTLKARRSGRFLVILLGMPFFFAGLAVMLSFGHLTTLTCDRVEPTLVQCSLASSGLMGNWVTDIPTGHLQGADIEVSSDSDGDDTYRVVLLTKGGTIPLAQVYSSGRSGKEAKVSQIHAFIQDPEQLSLTVQQNDLWVAIPVGGVFMLAGGGIILGSLLIKSQTECRFDKTEGQLYLTDQNAFQTDTQTYHLRQIRAAQVIEGTDSDGDKTLSLQLLLKTGEHLPLNITTDYEQMTDRINQFLGIDTTDPSSGADISL